SRPESMATGNNTIVPNLSSSPEILIKHEEVKFVEHDSSLLASNQHLRDVAAWFDRTLKGHGTGPGQGAGPAGFFLEPCNIVENLLGHFDSGLKILDLGCGCGLDSIALAAETNKVWGIDIAPERLAKARSNVSGSGRSNRISVLWMDAGNLAFP